MAKYTILLLVLPVVCFRLFSARARIRRIIIEYVMRAQTEIYRVHFANWKSGPARETKQRSESSEIAPFHLIKGGSGLNYTQKRPYIRCIRIRVVEDNSVSSLFLLQRRNSS